MANIEDSNSKRRRIETGFTPKINEHLNDLELNKILRSYWAKNEKVDHVDLKGYDVKVIQDPFPVCIIDNFVANPEVLGCAIEELAKFHLFQKSNDLYQFSQSDDLQNIKSLFCKEFFKFVAQDVRLWVGNIFDIEFLPNKVATTFSSYSYTDRLLCHDDKCEDRHIAFVLYLNKDWNESWGGDLQLFDHDSNGDPREVVKSVEFRHNRFVMFEVTDISFHQVGEVVKKGASRLSLNGWFHSCEKAKNSPTIQSSIQLSKTMPYSTGFDCSDYLQTEYLRPEYFLAMKKKFRKTSEMELDQFFNNIFYTELVKNLKEETIKWKFIGPANIRKYEVADKETLPNTIKTLISLLESQVWFEYLTTITGLDFIPDSEKTDMTVWEKGIVPHCNVELQRWTPGCYTLVHDRDEEFHSEALDMFIRVPISEQNQVVKDTSDDDTPQSGLIVYLDKMSKDDECLLECGSKYNSMSLVFREIETVRFIKYMDVRSTSFYQISCTYRQWSPPHDDLDLQHKEESETSESSGEDTA